MRVRAKRCFQYHNISLQSCTQSYILNLSRAMCYVQIFPSCDRYAPTNSITWLTNFDFCFSKCLNKRRTVSFRNILIESRVFNVFSRIDTALYRTCSMYVTKTTLCPFCLSVPSSAQSMPFEDDQCELSKWTILESTSVLSTPAQIWLRIIDYASSDFIAVLIVLKSCALWRLPVIIRSAYEICVETNSLVSHSFGPAAELIENFVI